MSITDPIADMLTMIRNAARARHEHVDLRASKLNRAIVRVLKEEGFIRNFREMPNGLRVYLRYDAKGRSFIQDLQRISRPGLRVYSGAEELRSVLRGVGMAVVSTSKGIMTDRRAREEHIGGEVLCHVW